MQVLVAQAEFPDAKAMPDAADKLRGQLGDPSVVVLGTAVDGRVALLVSASPGAVERGVKAGAVVKAAAAVVGGGGGGRDTMAQAGGRDPEKLPGGARGRAQADRGGAGGGVTPGDAAAGRVVALDYGSGRCGVAVSDPTGTLATPLDAVARPGTRKGFNRLLAAIRAQDAGAACVVGLPISLARRRHRPDRASRVRSPAGWPDFVDVPVELYDERFTTRMAQQRAGSAAEDSRAAAVLLEGWLDRESRFGPDRAI